MKKIVRNLITTIGILGSTVLLSVEEKLEALGNIAKLKAMSQIASETGIGREKFV